MSENGLKLVGSAKRAVPMLVIVGLLAVVVVGLLLIPDSADAGLKTTHWVDAWSYQNGDYRHSLIRIAFNGTWVPFLHQKDWDTTLITSTYGPPVCQTTGTPYAGQMFYTLGHTDTNGAAGFLMSDRWRLLDCDINQDGSLDGTDRTIFPPNGTNTQPLPPYPGLDLTTCFPGNPACDLLARDVITSCSNNTCATEIVTTFFLNLDLDCDGTPDPALLPLSGDPSEVCFYAEALTPKLTAADTVWGGNLQTRITEAGGDKTVNFRVDDWPTAVELAGFSASAGEGGVVLTWQTATELDNLGFNVYRAGSPDGEQVRVNGRMIASQSSGSAMGASYSFADDTAAAGQTYYYWLENVDVNGALAKDGPVEASMPGAKALPGRPRPSPRPSRLAR